MGNVKPLCRLLCCENASRDEVCRIWSLTSHTTPAFSTCLFKIYVYYTLMHSIGAKIYNPDAIAEFYI